MPAFYGPPAAPTTSPAPSPGVAVPPARGGRDGADFGALEAGLRALRADYAACGVAWAGILVKDGCAGDAVRIDADEQIVAASLYKLFVLWAVQVAIQAGQLGDDTALLLTAATDASADGDYALGPYGSTITVAEARRLMIVDSNNTAAWLLVEALGGWAAIESPLRDNAFVATETSPQLLTTPRDVTRFFEFVVGRTLDPRLTGADYALMLELLLAPALGAFLSPGLPAGVPFAHKTGNLDGVQHDADVVLPKLFELAALEGLLEQFLGAR